MASRTKRPPDPEAQAHVPIAGGGPVAAGRAEDPRIVEPGTAADDAATANLSRPRRTISGCSVVIVVIAVLDPLPDVAMHVVEAERIGRE